MQECNNTMTFEQVLDTQGILIYTNKGISMLPLLRQDKDVLIIEKKEPHRCNKYDVVLFKRKNGQYVLHRILKVQKNDYWIVGDNCISGEYIHEEQILGVLTGIIRNGKTIPVTDFLYNVYVQTWCRFYPVRFFLLHCRIYTYRLCLSLKRHIKK